MKTIRRFLTIVLILAAGIFAAKYFYERSVLEKIIARLQADSRAAQVLVTSVVPDAASGRNLTTIKFVEYDTAGRPLPPKYFTFPGNVIQFQALVVRFDDKFVMAGDRLRGKSVYLFWKTFTLEGKNTTEWTINQVGDVPDGYRVVDAGGWAQERFWRHFWTYALDREAAARAGIKNVQVEAPGTLFMPGYLYTIKIEHDGGLRIDTTPLPSIMRGEKVL